jgi:hypothetical protein
MVAESKTRGLIIDGVIGSEHVDSSGEILDVKGADISSLPKDGVLNYEHAGENNGGSFESIVGRCVKAKKIFKEADCENARERMYWEKTQVPFIYGVFRLFDESDHENARAAAAIIRDQHAANEEQILRLSIEGSTIEKVGNVLKHTIARAVALTRKPCNRTAITDVLHDPKAKKEESADALAELLGTAKGEDPSRQKLSFVPFVYTPFDAPEVQLAEALDRLRKTYGGVLGAQVGQTALERPRPASDEQRNRAKAALRDYDPHEHGEFRRYIKAQLPDASDDFLDYFSDLVDDMTVKGKMSFLRKDRQTDLFRPNPMLDEPGGRQVSVAMRVPGKKKKEGYPEVIQGIKDAHRAGDPNAPAIPPADLPAFKVRRRKVDKGDTYFDEQNGALYLSGQDPLKLYIPTADDYQYGQVLRNPRINDVHDRALDNWFALHKLARAGKLPPEVLAHSALFSAMSPNTAVPLQELAFARLQDLMGRDGWDPTKELPRRQAERYKREFIAMSKQHLLPQFMHDHFAARDSRFDDVWTKADYVRPVGLEQDKWKRVVDYPSWHGAIADAYRQFGADARSISGYLNQKKAESVREGNRAKREGDEDFQGFAAGFAPKTIRYLLAMAGMGNVLVPDTHLLRHTFGLMENDPRNKVVKDNLWDARNEPVLQAIDRYYFKHHPAVHYTREKIRQRYGEDIGEQALFPSFWHHWLTVEPHERMRGWINRAKNASTDHAVFFQAAKRILDKYGVPYDRHLLKTEPEQEQPGEEFEDGGSMPARCAHAMKEIENQFGTTPAHFAYYSFMVPALLGSRMSKAERLAETLLKAVREKTAGEKPKLHVFRGEAVEPGEVQFLGGSRDGWRNPLIHRADLANHPGSWHVIIGDDGSHMRLNPTAAGSSYRILSLPKPQKVAGITRAIEHGLPHLAHTPDQMSLLNGMDLAAIRKSPNQKRGATERRGGLAAWGVSKDGRVGFVKSADAMRNMDFATRDLGEYSSAQREAAFHLLARNVFGLGQHVPVTAAFQHPVTGEHHSVQEQVRAGEHVRRGDAYHDAHLHHLFNQGTLDKLALMDMVMDNSDRHPGNYLLTPGQGSGIHLIDNGLAFAKDAEAVTTIPHYWTKAGVNAHGVQNAKDDYGEMSWMKTPLHPEAARWVASLDPEKLRTEMERLGLPKANVEESVRRLAALKKRTTGTRAEAFFAPFLGRGHKPNGAMVGGAVIPDLSLPSLP